MIQIILTEFLIVPSNAITLSNVCWGSCDPCATSIESNLLNQLNLFPNPCRDKLEILSKNNFKSLEVLNYIGQIIYSNNMIANNLSVNTSTYNKGVYFVKIQTNSKISIHRFIKN